MAREVGQERGLALAESFRTLRLSSSTVRSIAGGPALST
jgi:hypothetical protein